MEEVAILSTCNRLELYCVLSEVDRGVQEVVEILAERSKLPLEALRHHLFVLLRQDAVMHLMRVAAGLDSLVLGEGQILSQVKNAYKLGQDYKGIARILNRLLKQAITAGKRVRTETSIGTGAVSISSAAVELAHAKVADLSSKKIAIIGAGKMSRLLVTHLLAKGSQQIAIVNRSQRRAQELACEFPNVPIQLYGLEEMMATVAASDIVFTSTGATEPILTKTLLTEVTISANSLMLIDISVPRNVHTDVKELAQVQAFNVDDLKAVVAANQESRRQMAREAEALLEQEVEAFELWWRSLDTVPTISCLRSKIEDIREQELEKALSRLGTEFAEKHQEVIEAMTRGIVNKILHEPMVQLRAQQDIEARKRCLQSLQMLFNLSVGEEYS